MDKVAEIMSNELIMIVVAFLVAFIIFKVLKKIVSAIITAVVIICIFMVGSYYFDDIKANFNIAINDGVLNVKVLDKTYSLDVDYIKNIEVTDTEDGKRIVFKSTKKDIKDITINVSNMAYMVVVKPIANKLDIEIVKIQKEVAQVYMSNLFFIV